HRLDLLRGRRIDVALRRAVDRCTMKTIVLDQPGQLSLTETSAPSLQSNQALVRMRRIGICGTDLHAFKGEQPFFTYPRVLGHELAVEVVGVGEHSGALRAGDRCA